MFNFNIAPLNDDANYDENDAAWEETEEDELEGFSTEDEDEDEENEQSEEEGEEDEDEDEDDDGDEGFGIENDV